MWRMLVVLLLLVVVGLVALGYCRGWYEVGRISNPEGDKTGVQITVDQDKVKADIDKAKQQISPAHHEAEKQ